jgi:hypothetical protein
LIINRDDRNITVNFNYQMWEHYYRSDSLILIINRDDRNITVNFDYQMWEHYYGSDSLIFDHQS